MASDCSYFKPLRVFKWSYLISTVGPSHLGYLNGVTLSAQLCDSTKADSGDTDWPIMCVCVFADMSYQISHLATINQRSQTTPQFPPTTLNQ